MIVGGYSLHLYCDYPDDDWRHLDLGKVEIAGHNEADCKRQAKAKGWSLDFGLYKALCPGCKAQGRKLPG